MKKSKVLLVIVALSLLAAVLVGCSSVSPQKVLSAHWLSYESVTYDVTRVLPDDDAVADNNPTIKGKQVITTERINKGSVKVGSTDTVSNFTGTLVTYKMNLDDGSYMDGEVAFNAKLIPIASMRKVYVKSWAENDQPEIDTRQSVEGQYIGGEFRYSALLEELKNDTVTASETKEGKLKLGAWDKSPYFDSLMMYHIGRASFSAEKAPHFRPLAFNIPSWKEGSLKPTSCSLATQYAVDIKLNDITYKTILVGFSYTQTFPGTGQPLWGHYNSANMPGLGKYALIKMVENNMVYTYASHTNTKPTANS